MRPPSHIETYGVVVDPADYETVIDGIDGEEQTQLRSLLAAKVFRHVSIYDDAVAAYMERSADWTPLPERLIGSLRRLRTLRYGENPDQEAAFYGPDVPAGLSALKQHHGKQLSYNNLLDLDGAILSLAPFAHSPRAAVWHHQAHHPVWPRHLRLAVRRLWGKRSRPIPPAPSVP